MIFDFRFPISDLFRFLLQSAIALVFCAGSVLAQDLLSEPLAEIPFSKKDADGISPTHVYAKAELLNRSLDQLIEVWNEKKLGKSLVQNPEFPPEGQESGLPYEFEQELRPMHVYQTMLICTWRLQHLDDHEALNVRHIPTMSSQPRKYDPRDVFFLVTMMLENVHRIAGKLNITDMPVEKKPEGERTPTDVFYQGVKVFMKLNALHGRKDLQPSEVYSQMVRAAEDARSILRQDDPACRYRIDCKVLREGETRIPGDVFGKCLDIRELIKLHCEARKIDVTPIPIKPEDKINPRDVFFQTQIIIAELNLLKLKLDTTSSTPLPIEVPDETTPTDVFQQALMVEHLVRQIKSGAAISIEDELATFGEKRLESAVGR